MFDLFGGVSHEHVNQVAKELYTAHATLMALLIHKGIITADEIDQIRPAVVAQIDQIFERVLRQKNKEALEESPGLGILAKLLGEEIPLPVEDEVKR